MKKFLYSSLIALAGIFAVSCEAEREMVIFNPDNVVAPTLGNMAGGTLAIDGADLELSFGAVDFGYDAAKSYALYASTSADFSGEPVKINAAFADGVASVKQSDLNTAILNLGGEKDVEFTLYLRITAWSIDESNTNIPVTETYSNVISATFIPYDALMLEKDVYEHVWVIGDYCGWDHNKTQFLYNYAKDGTTYLGVVDFAEKAANGFKLTGVAGWDDTCNWGSELGEETPEQSPIQLISSGGSKDIKAYSKRFYNFEFNKSSLTLKVKDSFNSVGVIGDFNSWGGDVVMEYNPGLVRFYADVEIPADGGLKVRADADWTVNWGVNAAPGGDNLSVAAGNYRIYLDLNKGTLEANAKMYGKDEPGLPVAEPVPFGWVVNGNFNGWGGEPVVSMKNTEGDIWVASKVKLAAMDEFKLTSTENAWVGGPEANATSTIDETNPYDVFKPELGVPFNTGDMNIAVGAEGEYDITYDAANGTITVDAAKANTWSLIGVNGDWENDIEMKEVAPGIWMTPVAVEITSGDWKLRFGKDWAVNRGGAAPENAGEFVEVSQDGANIALTGKHIIVYNANTETVGTLVWGLVGSIASVEGFSWNADIPMNLGADGKWYSVPVALTDKDEFKIRYMGAWDDDRGGACEAVEAEFDVTKGGSNIKAPKAGTYMVVYDPENEKITLTQNFWGLIGGFNEWGGDIFMMYDGAGVWKAYNKSIEGEWKIRKGATWDMEDRGGIFAAAGTAFEAVKGGSNIKVEGLASFDIIYDTTAETITIQ